MEVEVRKSEKERIGKDENREKERDKGKKEIEKIEEIREIRRIAKKARKILEGKSEGPMKPKKKK